MQIATKFDDAPLAYLLSLFSGIVYIAATIGLVTNRRWSRPLAWAAVGTEMVGVVTIGLASIIDSTAFPHDTVWSRFGAGYGYVPIILPVLGLMWLWQTRHAFTESHDQRADRIRLWTTAVPAVDPGGSLAR